MELRPATPVQARLIADIERLLSILLRRDVADPRLAGIALTRSERASHGHKLIAWVHRADETDAKGCIERLNRVAPYLMHELRQALPRRRLPLIEFRWDEAVDKGAKVLQLLNQIKN